MMRCVGLFPSVSAIWFLEGSFETGNYMDLTRVDDFSFTLIPVSVVGVILHVYRQTLRTDDGGHVLCFVIFVLRREA